MRDSHIHSTHTSCLDSLSCSASLMLSSCNSFTCLSRIFSDLARPSLACLSSSVSMIFSCIFFISSSRSSPISALDLVLLSTAVTSFSCCCCSDRKFFSRSSSCMESFSFATRSVEISSARLSAWCRKRSDSLLSCSVSTQRDCSCSDNRSLPR